MPRIRISARINLTYGAAGLFMLLTAASLQAQVTLEIKQGETWTTGLTTSTLQTLYMRWKYQGPSPATPAWQLSFTQPSEGTSPPPVKSGSVPVPQHSGDYASFEITPPSTAPSTFYIRVGGGNAFSSWVKVSVVQRAVRTDPTSSLAGALQTDPVRAGSTTDISRIQGALTAPSTFVIPGGDGAPNTPLWVTLTKIVCEAETNDGSPSDEAYLIVALVALNRNNMPASQVWVWYTSVYEDMDTNDTRVPNLHIWGSEDAGRPIPDPKDLIILLSVMERDVDNSREFAVMMGKAAIVAKLQTLSGTLTQSQIGDILMRAMGGPMFSALSAYQLPPPDISGDDIIDAGPVFLTQSEIDLAKGGTVARKPVTFTSPIGGRYQIRFQIGRQGVPSIVW